MITYYKNGIYKTENGVDKYLVQIACLHDDTKPSQDIVSGSLALEVDTGKMFAFDGSNWTEI